MWYSNRYRLLVVFLFTFLHLMLITSAARAAENLKDSSNPSNSVPPLHILSDNLPMGRDVYKNIAYAKTLSENGLDALSKNLLEKALKIYKNENDLLSARIVLLALSETYRETGDLDSYAIQMKNYFALQRNLSSINFDDEERIFDESLSAFGDNEASIRCKYINNVKRLSHPSFKAKITEKISLTLAECQSSNGDPINAYLGLLQAFSSNDKETKHRAKIQLSAFNKDQVKNDILKSIDRKKRKILYSFTSIFVVIILFLITGYFVLRNFDIKRRKTLAKRYYKWEMYEKAAEQCKSILRLKVGHRTSKEMLEKIAAKGIEGKQSQTFVMARPLFENIVSWLPFHYAASWAIICQIILFITYLMIRYYEENVENAFFIVFGTIGIYCCTVGLIWASKKLENSKYKINKFILLNQLAFDEWYNSHMEKLFNRNKLCIVGGFFLGVALLYIVYLVGGIWPSTIKGKLVLAIFTFVSVFVMGFTVTSIFPYVFMINEVADLPLKVDNKTNDIKEVGEISLKFTLIGVAIYLSYLLGCLYGLPVVLEIQLVEILMLPILIVFFITPQLRIHSMMVENKNLQKNSIDRQIQKLRVQFDSEPNERTAHLLRGMRERFMDVEQNPEWPFNKQAVVSVLSSVIIPFIFLLIQTFLF